MDEIMPHIRLSREQAADYVLCPGIRRGWTGLRSALKRWKNWLITGNTGA